MILQIYLFSKTMSDVKNNKNKNGVMIEIYVINVQILLKVSRIKLTFSELVISQCLSDGRMVGSRWHVAGKDEVSAVYTGPDVYYRQ